MYVPILLERIANMVYEAALTRSRMRAEEVRNAADADTPSRRDGHLMVAQHWKFLEKRFIKQWHAVRPQMQERGDSSRFKG